MSAAVADPKPFAGTPAEFVQRLSPDDQHALFLALLREALALNGDTGLLPVEDEDGRMFGYYVPPKAAEEIYRLHGPQLTEEQEREIDARFTGHYPDAIPIEEFIADLKRQVAELRQQQS